MRYRHCVPLLAALLAAGCDQTPTGQLPDTAEDILAAYTCTVQVGAQSLRCTGGPTGPRTGANGALIVGGQHIYVRLASSNVAYDGASFFTADVTLQNLLGQPMGTTDGATAHPDSIRVFFADGPTVTAGSGMLALWNADGVDTFNGSAESYFEYQGILTTEQVSQPKTWQFLVQSSVESFSFTVYVAAPVPDEAALTRIDDSAPSLAPGGYHSCALETGGAARCWGNDDDGQLGNGAGADSADVPTLVTGGHSFRSISAGRYHTCAVTTGNVGYCWGDNQTGQLGSASEEDAQDPAPVTGGLLWRVIDAGAAHSCGITTAHDLYCWGQGTDGRLGAGDSTSAPVPVPVLGGRKWASVSAGTNHTCAVTWGGAAYCWGESTNGQLGDNAGPPTARPRLVNGNHSWRSISAGEEYGCGVTSTGAGMCWGLDSSGQVGNGADPAPNVPTAVAGGLLWNRISAGRETSCGITQAGAAYCWGFNNTGEIGDGTTGLSDTPVAVAEAGPWARIGSGDYHSCGISAAGGAECWGYNAFGQLGRGNTDNDPFPQPVVGGINWKT